MNEKMTYKQALIRSLIVGGIITVCLLPFVINPNILEIPRILGLLIYGCVGWLLEFLRFIGLNHYYEEIFIIISPLIICLVSGNIIFLVLRNKQWLTPWRFIFIVLGFYFILNIISTIIAYILFPV